MLPVTLIGLFLKGGDLMIKERCIALWYQMFKIKGNIKIFK